MAGKKIRPIAVSMGEPAGIGGELALQAWAKRDRDLPPYFVIDDPSRLSQLGQILSLNTPVAEVFSPEEVFDCFRIALPVLSVGSKIQCDPGKPGKDTATSVCKSIERAVQFCLDGSASAITTLPIQKNTLYDAGFPYPGHTEYVGYLSNATTPVMMISSPMLRVVPVTVHQPLVTALRDLTTEMIIQKTVIAVDALKRDCNIQTPRIAVAGLNPHAGEDGNLGNEEQDIIAPAISALLEQNINAFGPVPPDSLFTARMRETYDLAICHYHDQALIPIKALDVDNAVNVTAGLSIIRTSPDHGTALDIAGTGNASPDSFIAALRLAGEMAVQRANST